MKRQLTDIMAFVVGLMVMTTWCAGRQDAAAGFSSGGEVGLRITEIGVGNQARPGDWAAIQVDVLHRSSNPKPMAVIVRMDVPNDDGDRGLHERVIVTNPNRPVTTWLYARLPFTYDAATTIAVSAFIPFDQEAGSDALGAYDPTKPVGMTSVLAGQRIVSPNTGLIAVVGRRVAQLDRYRDLLGQSTDFPLTGHEITQVNSGLSPSSLPDRVHGLRSLEAIVWTGAGADEQPGKLNVGQADAIREWVASGGHLVVVLPVVGQTWLDTPNPLSDIMPRVSAVRREGVSLEPIRFLLTGQPEAVPTSSIVQMLRPDPAAGPYEAMPLLTMPSGEVIAARRLVGIGAVTVIGLDLPSIDSAGALRTDSFWNRLLGKRLSLPTRKQVTDGLNSGQLFAASRKDMNFELAIPTRINRETKAALGLLVAVVVFGGFWLVAGPVGFFVLKQRNKIQHAWVAYVAAIGVFTALSWGAATLMRQRVPDARHVTILDHVYGQPCQRARMWANVFLPTYGTARISTPSKPFELAGRPLMPNPAIAPWESARSAGGSTEFPETRTYVVDARSPNSIEFPARATTRQVQVDWTGSPQWSMPLPQAPGGQTGLPLGHELSLAVAEPRGIAGRWTVNGTLTHDLPGPLHDVVIIVNRGLQTIGRLQPGQLTADAGIFNLSTPWKPGEALDLSVTTRHDNSQSVRAENHLDRITPKEAGNMFTNVPQQSDQQELLNAKTQVVSYLTSLSLYSMLAPPNPAMQGDTRTVARRHSTHTMDLGRWFTQPCVIVIGFVDGGSPVQLDVDGEAVPTDGLTAVRWVYPLPPAPPGYVVFDPSTSLTDGVSGGDRGDGDVK